MMNRRQFLSLVSASLIAPHLRGAEAQARRPNVVVILADDLGYADLSCHGSPDVRTPHIDSLAKNGVEFTQAYVPSPTCGPCRAGLLTGRYPQRFGFEFNPPLNSRTPAAGLPRSEQTLAEVLKDHGYATGLVGKWHLGLNAQHHPLQRGFGEFFGFLNSSHSYVDCATDADDPICRGTTPVAEQQYLTDAFSREAVSFIERHRDGPFFLYLSYNACHIPMDRPPARYLERFAHLANEKRQVFCAMLAAMDDGVGQVLGKLRELKLEEDTLVIFLSDNGGPTAATSSRNSPYRGGKGGLREGGIHVPMLLQWRSHLPAGQSYAQPISAMDIFPTALAAGEIKPTRAMALDGVNLLPFLRGKAEGMPHEVLFWRYGPESAIRRGNWKLHKSRVGSAQLFDVVADPGERRDRSTLRPELVKQLDEELTRWNGQLAKPMWPPSEYTLGGRKKSAEE